MTEVTNNAWPLAGYAPGNYLCICCDCAGQFEGDKRAFRCIECAAKAVNLSLRLSHSTHPKEAEVTVTEEMASVLSWAMDEIDALSNLAHGFAYPQGMRLARRQEQAPNYERAVALRAALVAALSRKG